MTQVSQGHSLTDGITLKKSLFSLLSLLTAIVFSENPLGLRERKDNESGCLALPSSTKRGIRHFKL